jgi:putative FmdB family regulatory protein
MPIYEYQCQQCEQHFEEMLPHAAADELHCPVCGAENVTRLLSLFGVGQTAGDVDTKTKTANGHGCGCGGCTCGHG